VKAALEHWLQARWYGGQRPGIGLRALAGLYRIAVQSRRFEPVRVGVPVFVDSDRVAAAQAAVAAGCDVVLADDGLQHRRLARDIEIEVVDGVRGYGNGLLLPAGPLREAPRPCTLRVVNGQARAGVVRPGDWPMRLEPGAVRPLDATVPPRTLADFAGRAVHAVAAIGHPARFFEMLSAHGLVVVPHAFPDHHAFTAADFAGIGRPLLLTAKDAVKCRGLGLADAWVAEVDATLDPRFFDALAHALDALDAAGP
jgi:tetraacyldisaccharide 4'-kinase